MLLEAVSNFAHVRKGTEDPGIYGPNPNPDPNPNPKALKTQVYTVDLLEVPNEYRGKGSLGWGSVW